jgi:hypothetical protein
VTADFDALVQVALLGTERQPPPEITTSSTPLGQLQQQSISANREQTLLSLAALSSLHERIGSLPRREDRPAPSTATPEAEPGASDHAGMFLHRLLKGEFKGIATDLTSEWLQVAAATKQLVPPHLLPNLLDAAREKEELRGALDVTVGERGRWLAKQNPRWNYLHASPVLDESKWETGELAERLAVIQKMRCVDPVRALELLQSTWKEEPPEERAAFIQKLEIRLAPSDEEFLQHALADKRKEVRTTAANLLARLPRSQYLGRLISRATPLLKFVPPEKSILLKQKPARIEVQLPNTDDKSLRADVLEAKAPKGVGEKIWIVIQLLQLIPLSTWTQAWSIDPASIVSAESEHKSELNRAWISAAIQQKDSTWADALFPLALASKNERLDDLLKVLTPESTERHLEGLFEAKNEERRQMLASLLERVTHGWSNSFSRKVLDWLRNITALESYDWQTRNQLVQFVPRLAPETLRESAKGWPVESKGWEFWKSGVDEFISAAQFRDEMLNAIRQKKLSYEHTSPSTC